MKHLIPNNILHILKRIEVSLKWVAFSILSGCVIGTVGTLFSFSFDFATLVREKNPWLVFLLPVGGLLIVAAYRLLRSPLTSGTNLVLSAIHSGDYLPLRMAPLIFFGTLITHLFGGSTGREGAALQLGGSIGGGIGRLFRFDKKDKNIMIMCGMSASFSSLFGTPIAAAIFSMEVVSVGIMHYSALVPCVIASLISHAITSYFGVSHAFFPLRELPSFTVSSSLIVSVLAVLCAILSIVFCAMIQQTVSLFHKYFTNPYVRIFVGGCILMVMTLLVGNQSYSGSGLAGIAACFSGSIPPETFFLKMLFTAITLGAGYKGGEILPALFTGAAFGVLFSSITGFSLPLSTAVGMSAIFCGVTNCPITSLLISLELFGYEGMPYFLLAIAFSYMLSGYWGLYQSQKIIYSKYKTDYINKK